MPVPTSDLVTAAAVITFAALVQGVVGIGFNVVAVPILRLISPLLAPVPSLGRRARSIVPEWVGSCWDVSPVG